MFGFSEYGTYAGEELCGVPVEGFDVVVTVESDDDSTPPWERDDGHGPVSRWLDRDKRAGELVLNTDRGSKRFYDFAEACRIARADGWGCRDGRRKGESDKAYAARAAMEDYQRLKDWCEDRWSYVGLVVTASRKGVDLGSASLWGLESDGGADWLEAEAASLVSEAAADARAKLAEMVAEEFIPCV